MGIREGIVRRFVDVERLVVGALAVVAFVAFWQIVAAMNIVDPLFISSPSRILAVAIAMADDPDFPRDLSVSFLPEWNNLFVITSRLNRLI